MKSIQLSSASFIRMARLAAAILLSGIVSPGFAQGGVWTSKAGLPSARSVLRSAVVEEKIYVFGGVDPDFNDLAITDQYDPMTDTWTNKTDMPTPRFGHCACAVNGKIYVIGGVGGGEFLSTVEEYDPATDTWETKADMPTSRAGLSCQAVDGKLYAMGGDTINGLEIITLPVVEEYDPVTDTWTAKADMPVPRGAFAGEAVEGLIYAMGGFNNNGPIATVDVYDPSAAAWVTLDTHIPTPRCLLSASALNGMIYAIGGQSETGESLPTVEAYDPANNSWMTMAPMPTARLDLATSAVGESIYAIGGIQFSFPDITHLSTVEAFNLIPSSAEAAAGNGFALYQNYPNPFNGPTTISFTLAQPSFVRLAVYDLYGRKVSTLLSERRGRGRHQLVWEARDLASGMYMVRLETPLGYVARKAVLSKFDEY